MARNPWTDPTRSTKEVWSLWLKGWHSHGHFFPEPTMVEPGRSSRCAVVKPLRLQRWDALMLNLFTERIPTSTNNAPPVPILCCILSPFFLGWNCTFFSRITSLIQVYLLFNHHSTNFMHFKSDVLALFMSINRGIGWVFQHVKNRLAKLFQDNVVPSGNLT